MRFRQRKAIRIIRPVPRTPYSKGEKDESKEIIGAAGDTLRGGYAAGGLPPLQPDTPIDPVLIFSAETNLTVSVDGSVSDALSDTVPYGEAVTLTAPEVAGKTFQYWTNAEGTVISYSQELPLTMYANTAVNAVYDTAAATAQPVAEFLNITRSSGEIIFNAIASAPSGSTAAEAGIRYSATKTTLNDLKGSDGVTVESAASTATNWTLNVTPSDESATYYAVAYVTSGSQTYYSAVKAVKLSELNYGVSMVTNLGDIQLPDNMNISFCTVTFDATGGAGSMEPQGLVQGSATPAERPTPSPVKATLSTAGAPT